MSTLTPTSLPSESPESRALASRGSVLPALPQTVEDTRRELLPQLQIAHDHAAEAKKQEALAEAERMRPRAVREPAPVASAPFRVEAVPPPAPRAEVSPKGSVMDGAVVAGVAAAGAATLYPYATNILAPMVKTAAVSNALPAAGTLGYTLGIPAAGAAVGYYLGKKFKQPAAGAFAGAGVGAAATMAFTPLSHLASIGAAPFWTALTGESIGLSALSSVGLNVLAPVAAGVGGALYGLGRWYEKVRGSKPGGILKTMARGVVAPVMVPMGYLLQR